MTVIIPQLRSTGIRTAVLFVAATLAFALPAHAARLTLKSICRIKGQEENTIQGLGVVVGLKGTGDNASYLPTIRSVGKIMTSHGQLPRATPASRS